MKIKGFSCAMLAVHCHTHTHKLYSYCSNVLESVRYFYTAITLIVFIEKSLSTLHKIVPQWNHALTITPLVHSPDLAHRLQFKHRDPTNHGETE